jgi:hypothetical protein
MGKSVVEFSIDPMELGRTYPPHGQIFSVGHFAAKHGLG